MYICSEQIYVIENLPPRRRTANDIAVCADGDFIRQLATGWKILRNVLVIRSRPFQVLAQTRMWIENQNAFPQFIAKRLNRTNLIRISCNQDKALNVRANGIKKHRNGDIDI